MSLSDIWFLYRARLRARSVLVQEGFAIAGIAVGVALLFASQVASTSLTHSVARTSEQIVGNTQFQLDARGPGGLSERVLASIRRMPYVVLALPVVEQQATVVGRRGERSIELIGTDPRFARRAGPLLRRFSAKQLAAQQALAVPSELAREVGAGPLETLKLRIGARTVTTLLGATLTESDIGELAHSPIAVAPIHYAQQLANLRGKVSRIFVRVAPGHERRAQAALRGVADRIHVNLEPANYESTLFSVAASPATQSETLFSTLSALVGFMFAINAMLMTVPLRRRLIANVRTQGATRSMTAQILAFDAIILGLLSCVGGLILGDLLSIAVFHTNPGYLAFAFPVGNQRLITWQSVAVAVLAGMAAAAAGVLWPLRDLMRRPLSAGEVPRGLLRQSRHLRLIAGVALVCATTAVLLLDPAAALVGAFTLVLALLCLLPMLFDAIVSGFDRLQRPFKGASARLAVTELRAGHTRIRSLAIAATGAVAVFGVVAIQGAQLNLQRGLDDASGALDRSASLWVLPSGEADAFATIPFDGVNSTAIASVAGVREVAVLRGGFLDWGTRRLWVLAPPADQAERLAGEETAEDGSPRLSRAVGQTGWVAISRGLAAERHLHVGEVVWLPTPHPVRARIATFITNLGWPPGAMITTSQEYALAWASAQPSAYEVQLSRGAASAEVRRNVYRALGSSTGLAVERAAERVTRHRHTTRAGLARLTEIRILVLLAAILAVTGAMVALIWQRRELVAFVKCHGYRRGVLWRWLLCEGALLLAAGCAIGAIFGLYGELLLSHALASVTGFPIRFHTGALIALANFGLVTSAAIGILAVAGYFVVRVPPRAVAPAY
ncbi:MAG: FtsX-like permease family protein [Solirubrobacteraceae bacterium]